MRSLTAQRETQARSLGASVRDAIRRTDGRALRVRARQRERLAFEWIPVVRRDAVIQQAVVGVDE